HQAIYGWRGASAGGLERFPRMFPRADGSPARQLSLSLSWRNSAQVLEVANALVAPLREASSVDVPALRALPPRPGPGAAAAPSSVAAVVRSTLAEESEAVVAFLREHWHEPNRRMAARGERRLRTAAVLCRRRSQFPAVVEALRAAGFEPEVVGLGGLL